MVIERLLRQPYRLTMFRGSNYNGTIPERTVVKFRAGKELKEAVEKLDTSAIK